MATGDIAATGMSASDISSLLGLVSPPGSNNKNVGEQDTETTKGATNGVNNTYTHMGPTDVTSTIGGSTKTQTIGPTHSTSTTQEHVDAAGVNRAIQQILEGSQGLAATAAGQHISGAYNSTTDMMLKNDLAVRTAGTVSLLNKSSTTTTDTAGSTNTLIDSGSVNSSHNTGYDSGVTNVLHADPVTDIVKNAPYQVNTTQVAQVSGKVAAGLAAGTLIYNALGQLVSKATGKLVDSVTGSFVGGAGAAITDTLGLGAATEAAGSAAAAEAIAAAGATAGEGLGAVAVGEGAVAAGEGLGLAEGAGLVAEAGEGAGLWEAAAAVLAWIVCTELVRQNKLNKRWYFAGSKVFNSYSEIGKLGYYIWAIPCVRHLRNNPDSNFSWFLEYIFNWRAEYIAACAGVPNARKLKKGMLVSAFLYPACHVIGYALYFLNIKTEDYHVIYS